MGDFWLGEAALRALAGAQVFERGRHYANAGLVDLEEVDDDYVSATVHGTDEYAVDLADEGDGELTWGCTCPHAEDGTFCEHLVAAALVAADTVTDLPVAPRSESDGREISTSDLRGWLTSLVTDELVQLVMEGTRRDAALRATLLLRVAADKGLHPQLGEYRRDLAAAFATGGFVAWREMPEWSADVGAALDGVEQVLEAGYAEAARALADEAWTLLGAAYGRVDDSNGELGWIGDRIVDLHLAACAAASGEQEQAARRVLSFALDSELDTFRDRLGEYREALGEEAWEELRRSAELQWETVPARGPGAADPDRYGRRFRIIQVMEALAGNDLERLIAVRSRSLTHPYDWVRIVEACATADRNELAVEWGERAIEAFGHDTDARVADALSDAYVRAGRHEEALALERHQFARSPEVGRYVRLRAVAQALGRWSWEREEAYTVARRSVATAQRNSTEAQRRSPWWQTPASLIVELLLEDGDADAAWEEAVTNGCTEKLWLRMAAVRGDAHPADAIEVYRRELSRVLEPAKDPAYAEVVKVLEMLRPLYARDGRPEEFSALVAEIRQSYKRRSNLMKRLDRAGL